jgi:hypothetical protein
VSLAEISTAFDNSIFECLHLQPFTAAEMARLPASREVRMNQNFPYRSRA